MTKQEHQELQTIAETEPWLVRRKLTEFLERTPIEETHEPRTSQQLKAIWVDCQLIAEKLEAAGIDWKMVMSKSGTAIPVTKDSVMSLMWRPVMKVLYNHDSTKKLEKTKQIDKIHEVIMRTLGERHGIEWHDFPHVEKLEEENSSYEYPEYTGPPTV